MTGWPVAYTIASPECREIPHLAYQAELPRALDELAELGYDGVEVQVRDADAAVSAGLVDQVEARGLRVAALATGPVAADDGLTFTLPDATTRAEAVRRVRDIVDLAVAHDVPVTLGRTKGELADDTEDAQRGWAHDAIGELGARAAAGGQALLVEPQSGGFLNTVGAALRFVCPDAEPLPGVALVLDLWHAVKEERQVDAAVHEAGSLMHHVQLADTGRGPVGAGTYDVAGFLSLLRQVGYEGWLTLEHEQGDDSRTAAATSLSTLRRLEGKS